MKTHSWCLAALCSVPMLGACADDQGATGPELQIEVAPLTLPGATGVEYALAVYNGTGIAAATAFGQDGVAASTSGGAQLVWNEPSVTSTVFGNGAGGDISYVGPCDADGSGGVRTNSIALALKQVAVGTGGSIDGTGPNDGANSGIFVGDDKILDDQITATSGGDGDADFQNPCPYNAPCVLTAQCKENADTSVVFNLTIMRDANQGFFDLAVNFEDVFCSAKYDTCTGGTTTTTTPRTYISGGSTYYIYTDGGVNYYMLWDGTAWDVSWFSEGVLVAHVDDVTGTDSTPPTTLTRASGNGHSHDHTWTLATQSVTNGAPINLLFGTDANGKSIRQWTGVAALACTVGADTGADNTAGDIETTLLLGQPTVVCEDSAGVAVTFTLPLAGKAEGNQATLTASSPSGSSATLDYALYFGNESLDCGNGAGSCNKVYYNIAFNLQKLADQNLANCQLSYKGTATNGTSVFNASGDLVQDDGQYGVVAFGDASPGFGVPLTGGDHNPFCSENPVGGTGSQVQPGYLKGKSYTGASANPGLDFWTQGSAATAFN